MTTVPPNRILAAALAACLSLCSNLGLAKPISWDSQAILTPSTGAAPEQFGTVVAIDGDTVLIGAPGNNDTQPGSVYAWVRTGSQWQQRQKFSSPNPIADQQFGSALAVKGNLAAVGAIGDEEHGPLTGAAYIFSRTGATWSAASQKLTGDEISGDSGERFGAAVAVGTDLVLVGAPFNDEKGVDAGAAYLFKRQGSSWLFARKLFALDPQAGAGFGNSVALGDGVAVVGAPDANSSDPSPASGAVESMPDTGAVYVFSGDFTGPPRKLVSSDHVTGDAFGIALSVSGSNLAVSASLASGGRGPSAPAESGAVYVFNGSGSTWLEQQKLTKPSPKTGELFGLVSAIGNDSLFVVSRANGPQGYFVFAFTLADQTWSDGVQVLRPAELGGALFTPALGISGKTVVIGTLGEKAAVLGLATGSHCSVSADCSQGNCTEGVCCATLCDGKCFSCLGARKASGTEDGSCEPITEGADPRDACAEQLASSCGTTGVCDGAGSCSRYPVGTECAAASCSTTTTTESSTCDGAGQCLTAADQDCGSYLCRAGLCPTACTSSTDCAPGSFCNASSACAPLQPKRCNANGTAAIGTDGTTLTQCGDYRCFNGECLDSCTSSDDCSSELGCNLLTGVCATQCTNAASCTSSQACDAVFQVCTTFCATAGDCAEGNNCGPVSRQCTKKADCIKPSDCSTGFTCDSSSQLCAKTCDSPSDCPTTAFACDPQKKLCTLTCSSAVDCAAGFNCGPTHHCTTDAACAHDVDCATPFVCDTASSRCAARCSSPSDCDNDFACSPDNHVCTEFCSVASDCRVGLNCGQTHRCTTIGYCSQNPDCAAPFACDQTIHQCATRCSSPNDCDGDFACDPVNHLCTSGCSSASNCQEGLNCGPKSHHCTYEALCSSSNDCAAGSACNPNTKQCVTDQRASPSPVSGSCSLGRGPNDWSRQGGVALALLALLSLRRRIRVEESGRISFPQIKRKTET